MTELEIMQQRHSVRQYADTPIEQDKRTVLNELAEKLNTDAGVHIQIIYDEPKCFDSFMAHYGKFSGVKNYIALVGKAQELGLNTCWVAMTHGKSAAKVESGEKLVCLIALGYGAVQGVEHKSKPMTELCVCPEPMPEWFKAGMEAALLAPTAMNQQKFKFELLPDGSVKASCGTGFYTKLDLGIVRYHFEAASKKKTV